MPRYLSRLNMARLAYSVRLIAAAILEWTDHPGEKKLPN